MGIMGRMLSQRRKPTGWVGRLVARGMNTSHSRLTDWGLKRLSIGKGFTILDIGCGGGITISKLARIATEGLREFLTSVGYAGVEVFEEYDNGWICAVGRKPTKCLDGKSPG